MSDLQNMLINGLPIPGVFKIDDKAEETKEVSQTKLKAVQKPWMRTKTKEEGKESTILIADVEQKEEKEVKENKQSKVEAKKNEVVKEDE